MDERRNEVQGGKPPALVFLFSLLPGAGHMYMGLMTRGLHLMVLFFGMVYLGSTGFFQELWGMVVAPVIWFFSFFDALRLSGRLQRGETVVDKGIFAGNGSVGPSFWGWALVGMGALLLVGNLLQLNATIMWWARRTLPALLLVGLGVAILWHQWHQRPPLEREQPPLGREQPPLDQEQPLLDREQPPLDEGRPPRDSD